MSKSSFMPICDLREEHDRIDIMFKVLQCDSVRIVKSKRTGKRHLLQYVTIADETGMIRMVLWNDDCETLREGVTYSLRNGVLKTHDLSMQVSLSSNSELRIEEQDIGTPNTKVDMSRPFMGRTIKRRRRPLGGEGRTFHGAPSRTLQGYCTDKEF